MEKQKTTFKIIIIENGQTQTFYCESEKEKNKWLYEYLTCQEKMWAWEQYNNSPYKTFDKWFKKFVKSEWKESDLQSFRIKNQLILIKKINKR